MKKPIYRVSKTRQDQLVDKLADQLMTPDSFIRDLSPELMQEAFRLLAKDALEEHQGNLEKLNAAPEERMAAAELELRAQQLSECAWAHFAREAQTRFRLALVELMHESLGFMDAIYAERCGKTDEEIREARPTLEEIEHNVLRHALVRLHKLPIQHEPTSWHNDDVFADAENLQLKVARLIFKDLSLWSYDYTGTARLFQQLIRPFLAEHESPDDEAALWANESAEVVWEHIGGATQIMLLILVNWALLLSKHSAVKRQEVELDLRQAKQIQPSKEQLKKIADTFIGLWLDGLSFDWRASGRAVKKTREIEADRERLSHELHELVAALVDDDVKITWEALAVRRDRPPDNLQSGESLRKEAAALNLSLSEFKPEKN